MADVFVSYSHKNTVRVEPIAAGFDGAGLTFWWDRKLMPGDQWRAEIENELVQSKCAVIAWSRQSRDSFWVHAEASLAADSGKLVQLRLDGARVPLPFYAALTHDFREWSGARSGAPWSDLEGQTRRCIGGERFPNVNLQGSALQGLGSFAWFGWVSLALVMITGLLTVGYAHQSYDAGFYAMASSAAFGAALICFAATFVRFLQFANASKRR